MLPRTRCSLAVSCGVLALLLGAGCKEEPAPAAVDAKPTQELVIITPHDQPIREAFGVPFSLWYEKKTGQIVTIRWIYRGTLDAQQEVYSRSPREPYARRPGLDVFFGGGIPVHRELAERGYSQPVKVPEAVLAGIPKELNGQPLYAPDGSWYGTALSGYGILYNKRAAESRGLPIPQTWADLAGPAYQGWVAAADPAASGSTVACLVLALLKHGWVEGWGIVNGIAANCNGLLPSSGMIGPTVSSGMAVAGLEPEFVARQVASAAPDTLGCVDPPAATAITADPVTVLKGAAHAEAARGFVEFVLSPEGQALWVLSADAGGPDMPLYRYPVRPDIYDRYGAQMVIKRNPFKEHDGLKIDPNTEAAYTRLLPVLLEAACGRNHFLMQRAWATARKEGEGSAKLAGLRTPPFDEAAALKYADEVRDPKRARALAAEWSGLFQRKYAAAVGAPTTSTSLR